MSYQMPSTTEAYMRNLLLATALSAATVTPAAAQNWRPAAPVRSQIQQDINQLDRQIARAQQRRTLSARESTSLRRQALKVRRDYARYSRNGLTRTEVAVLERQVNQLRRQLRLEQRDWDGRRG